jgi:hypothetical protein
LVITFNEALNAASASNTNAYQVIAPGPDRQPGTGDDIVVPITSATYDAATRTVTLLFAQRLYLYDEYMLIIKGTGANAIIDANGVALDGKANGQPGSDYMAVFGRQNLAGPAPGSAAAKTKARTKTKAHHSPNAHSALKLSRSETSQIKHWHAIMHSANRLKALVTVKQIHHLHSHAVTIRK